MGLAGAVVVGLLGGGLIATPALAEDPGELTITKTASVTDVEPGDTFTYTIVVTCTNIGSGGCTNAAVSDTLPEGISLQPNSSISVTGATGDTETTGDGFTVTFTDSQTDPAGAQGLDDGATATITVPVAVDDDIDPELSGTELVNSATVDGTNTQPVTDTATVVPDIPITLAASTDKSFDPASAIADPGTATTLSLSGGNASNVPVDEITLTDPVTPPGAFEYLGLTGAPTVSLPAGAEQVEVDVYVDGNWINGPPSTPPATLPSGVDPADVQGVRIHFISTDGANIAPDASGSVEVPLEQRDNIADAGDGAIPNDVSTNVSREGADSDPATAAADYTILAADIDLSASKLFDPDTIAAGSSSTVTIGATNTSDRTLDSLTITEPGDDPNMFENGLTFTGWGSPITWPAGATGATVTYTYADDTTDTLTADGPNTLPDPAEGEEVVGFTVEFTGPIQPGAEASIPFTVLADDTQSPDVIDHPNTITAESTAPGGYHGDATASDTLTTIIKRVNIEVSKRVSPAQIFSLPGQTTLVELTGVVTDFPDSTANANEIIVTDPADPANDDWYDVFAPSGVVETPIPADATLTVQYYNGTEWVDVPGMANIPGPDTFSGDFPPDVTENAQGIRFVYDSDAGFPPGTQVNPNIGFEVKASAAGQDLTVPNCAGASASSDNPIVGDANDSQSGDECPTIHVVPADPGNADFIDKDWDDPKAVGERTEEQAGLTIDWSTSGAANIDQMVISDVPAPTAAGLESTVFDSFDLVRIDPITAAMDSHLTYDQVTGVELYSLSQDAWVDAPGDPCPAACDGTFPGYTLDDASLRADTIAFRLIFAESPTRADRAAGDPEAPAVGSGVARSSGNDRQIHPVFQIRDELRSNPGDPVLADDVYNNDDQQGIVRNTARASVIVDDQVYVDQNASDEITITPVNVTADITKSWSGGPLGVPEAGTADFPDEYPTGRVTLEAKNTTPRKVDSITITEPVNPTDPFDVFNLKGFADITDPAAIGADSVTFDLQMEGGGSMTVDSREAMMAMTETQLTDVVGFTAVYSGRIDSAAVARLVFDTRLRQTHRADGTTPVTASGDSPVDDIAATTVSDLDDYPGVEPRTNTDASTAGIELNAQGIDLEVTKEITPESQTEPDRSPVTVILTGQPEGPSRTNRMMLTDNDPTFFNAYDFVGFGDFDFAAPIDQVQVDAYVGGTFTEVGDAVVVTGGDWVEGTPGSSLTLPDTVTAAQVQGLRFTFTRADGSIWENPATPKQTVLLQVQRRLDLRTGGPVTSDLQGNDAMPGEEAPGVSSDTVNGQNWAADTIDGEPLSATGRATDTILYRHSYNAVTVSKAPTGAQPPAADIPYTLTFTNTGDTPIIDPVITDRIPSDGDGPLLVKDPELADGDTGYTYTLEGDAPDPSNGTPMPSDAAGTSSDVAVDETPTLLTFAFPEGTVLEVGQTYTITTALQFRTGLPGDTNVTNTTGITGDRAWDDCVQTLDDDTGECQASTTVYPVKAGALRGVKMVKADDDELGVLNTRGDPDGCRPNADGFYVGGCVPVTKPGQTDTWRFQFTNTGNLPQDKVYAIDRLPTPGDTGAITSLERGSQWTPVPQTVTFVGAAEGTVSAIRVYYDTDQELCTDDLDSLAGCPDGSWTLLATVADPTPGASVDLPPEATAIKVEADFTDDMLKPAGTLTYDLQTRAPTQSDTAGEDTIAWNTVAGAAETDDAGAKGLAPKSEGNKVGAALATGPLQIEKVVTGPAAEYAPAEFDLTLVCTSAGEDVDLGNRAQVTVTANQPVQIEDLPWGSDCTVTEDAASGATDFSATTVTVVRADQTVPIIVATNTYDDASLSLTKDLGQTALDENGDPVAYGPFTFDVECTFLGEPVYAAGYGTDDPMVATIAAGGTVTFTQLPAGSDCTATETASDGASNTSWSLNGADYSDGDTAALTLDPDGAGGAVTNEIAFLNDFPLARLQIEKDVTGAGAGRYGTGPFTVHVHCVKPGSGDVVYDDDIVLGGADPLTATITDLFDGASCLVTEPQDGGATVTTIDPDEPFIVTGDDPADPVTVTVENRFQLAPVRVHKQLSGFGVNRVPDGTTYTVALECTRVVNGETVPVAIPGGAERTLTYPDDLDAVFRGLPVGATCTLTETDTGDATQSVVSPDGPFAIGTTAGVSVEVTNQYWAGAVRVIKRLDGAASTFVEDGTEFTVQLSCTITVNGETVAVPIPGDGVRTITWPDDRVLYVNIPLGSECAVTEPDSGGATSTSFDPQGSFTVTSRVLPVMVTATNVYDPGALQIVKHIEGTGAATATGPFVFDVVCAFNGNPEAYTSSVTLRRTGPGTMIRSDIVAPLPVGAVCTVTETGDGGADRTPPAVMVTIRSSHVERAAIAEFVNTFTAPPAPAEDGGGILPVTGGMVAWPLLAAALGMIGTGVFMFVRRRRTE